MSQNYPPGWPKPDLTGFPTTYTVEQVIAFIEAAFSAGVVDAEVLWNSLTAWIAANTTLGPKG